jgi:hypothetical protein
MFGKSYSLKIVIKWLNEKNIKYKISSSGFNMSPYATGCRIRLNDSFELSIQTDPSTAGDSFAETALISTETGSVAYGPGGYGDVKRHDAPDDLFEEIEWLLTQDLKMDQE